MYSPHECNILTNSFIRIIHYSSIEGLTDDKASHFFSPQTSFLSMEISVCTTERLDGDQRRTWQNSPPISTDNLSKSFQNIVHHWKKSQYREEIQQALGTVPFVLDKVVAFGCGPLTLNHGLDDLPMNQHAFLLMLQSCIPHSKCYIQDPLYEKEDKHVLESFGFHVLDDPEGFLIVDEASILVSIHVDAPVKQIVVSKFRRSFLLFLFLV